MTVLDTLDLTRSDDAILSRRARTGDPEARRALIERYLPLARRLARRYIRSGEPLEDLVQVASLALLKTVDRWEPAMGNAFSSYAVPTILGELRRHFRDTTWMVRPPRALLELGLLVDREREALAAALGREPTVGELADRLGRPAGEVAEALEAAAGRSLRSLDAAVHDPDREHAVIADLIGHEDDEYARVESRTTIERLVQILDERAREVLRMRFEQDLLQCQIAAAVGCSQMHVSRILRSSIEELSAHAA